MCKESFCPRFFPPGQCQHCERGGRGKSQHVRESLRRCNQELMERPGHPGVLRSKEGIPALRLHKIVSREEHNSRDADIKITLLKPGTQTLKKSPGSFFSKLLSTGVIFGMVSMVTNTHPGSIPPCASVVT